MTKVWKAGTKFAVVSGETVQVSNEPLPAYAAWRVVRADDHSHLICAFYGGASLLAACAFLDKIEEEWEIDC